MFKFADISQFDSLCDGNGSVSVFNLQMPKQAPWIKDNYDNVNIEPHEWQDYSDAHRTPSDLDSVSGGVGIGESIDIDDSGRLLDKKYRPKGKRGVVPDSLKKSSKYIKDAVSSHSVGKGLMRPFEGDDISVGSQSGLLDGYGLSDLFDGYEVNITEEPRAKDITKTNCVLERKSFDDKCVYASYDPDNEKITMLCYGRPHKFANGVNDVLPKFRLYEPKCTKEQFDEIVRRYRTGEPLVGRRGGILRDILGFGNDDSIHKIGSSSDVDQRNVGFDLNPESVGFDANKGLDVNI